MIDGRWTVDKPEKFEWNRNAALEGLLKIVKDQIEERSAVVLFSSQQSGKMQA